MIDDWGDKAGDFYDKNENIEEIRATAQVTRQLVQKEIGLFSEFESAHKEWDRIARAGGAPRRELSPKQAEMAIFYTDIVASTRTLHAQWEHGDYSAAEESFLAINRQGVRLDDLESLLIEYRNGSMARVIMSIANGGATGHYWPQANESVLPLGKLREKLSAFDKRCSELHRALFVPPFDAKIVDVNVTFIVAPGHFRPHAHLIELLPLLSEEAAIGREQLPEILGKDHNKGIEDVIINADSLLSRIERKLEHVGTGGNGSLSLSLAPLLYWYNRKGVFVRALMYGWMHWLLSGSEDEVRERKVALSSVRGELEEALAGYKNEFAEIQHRGGAGLKSLASVTDFIQRLVETLLREKASTPENRDAKLRELFGIKSTSGNKMASASRSFSKGMRAEINIRELLRASLKCEICGGIVDLKQGVQYDHKEQYALGGLSTPDNGRPTHPFCNLLRDRITAVRAGKDTISLPKIRNTADSVRTYQQLTLFDTFPGE